MPDNNIPEDCNKNPNAPWLQDPDVDLCSCGKTKYTHDTYCTKCIKAIENYEDSL